MGTVASIRRGEVPLRFLDVSREPPFFFRREFLYPALSFLYPGSSACPLEPRSRKLIELTRNYFHYDLLSKITDNCLHLILLRASSPIRKKCSATTKDEAMLDEMSVMMVGVQIPFLPLIFSTMTDNPIQQPTIARQLPRAAL